MQLKVRTDSYCQPTNKNNDKNKSSPANRSTDFSYEDNDMVLIPAGYYLRGSAADDPDRDPYEPVFERVYVPAFYIDKYEYPGKTGVRAMDNVSWYEAKALCEKAGKRLCTGGEWEKACKGPSFSKYPYGNTYISGKCNDNARSRHPVIVGPITGSYKDCISGYGVHDMSGGVAEWTSEIKSASFNKGFPIARGGDMFALPDESRCANRDHFHYTMNYESLDTRSIGDGFRCCKNADDTNK